MFWWVGDSWFLRLLQGVIRKSEGYLGWMSRIKERPVSQVAKETHIRVIHLYRCGSWKLAPLAGLPTIWSEIGTLPPEMDGLQVGTGWQKDCGHTAGKWSLLLPVDHRETRTTLSAFYFLWKPFDTGHEMMKLKSPWCCCFGRIVFLRCCTQSFSRACFWQ